jgi:Xaa-Pro aminopeptidase
LDALLITPGPDLRYLTGYDAKPLERLTCLVLAANADPTLVVPALERPAAEASGIHHELEIIDWQESDDPIALVAQLLPGASRIALGDKMWAEKVLRFRDAMPHAEQVLAGPLLTELRMRKSPEEVEFLREAAEAIDRVHARMSEWLRADRTEHDVARDIAVAIVEEGHATADFTIVAAGANSASPHHEPDDTVIADGDPVVVDIGGTTSSGYCSDSTRTYVIGEPPSEFAKAYDALLQAQIAACDHVRAGVAAESVDAAARDLLTEAGLGEYFFHRIGHGIGMETHEEPYIIEGNSLPLEAGMAFSVEPGFYFAGKYGARIEDIVVATEDGVDRLNQRPRELAIL